MGLNDFRRRNLVKVQALLPRQLRRTVALRRGDLTLLATSDFLDAKIIHSVTSRDHDIYFPSAVGDPEEVTLVLEVGAHHGIYTAVAAEEYPNARIIAVEPSLDALLALRNQIAANSLVSRVEVIPAAISDSAGLAVLSHEPSGSWGATLHEPDAVTFSESVVTLTLADVLRGRVVDVLKSNAEGAEFALVGQLELQEHKPRVVVMAVHPDYGDEDALRERMTAMGYSVETAIDGHHPVWSCVLD